VNYPFNINLFLQHILWMQIKSVLTLREHCLSVHILKCDYFEYCIIYPGGISDYEHDVRIGWIFY